MFYNGGESGPVTLAGKGRTCTNTNWRPCWSGIKVFGWGVCERFNVLKRLVVAETEEIEENAVKRVALATGVCSHACPNAV